MIKLKRGKFFRDQVVIWTDVQQVAEAVGSSDGKLGRIVQSWIKKPARAVQLEIGHKGIPICHRSPGSSPCVLVEAGQAERIRNQCRARHVCPGHYSIRDLLRIEGLAVEKQFSVEFARAPAIHHRAHVCLSCPEQIRD